MGFPMIPFRTSAVVTRGTASGVDYPDGFPWALGTVFADADGKLYAFWEIATALTNDTFANNEVCYPTTTIGVVTNTVANAVESSTYPICAGVARGSLAESTSTTTVRAGLFQIFGRGTVVNSATDATIGERMICDTGANGGAIKSAGSATSADGIITQMTVGTAMETSAGLTAVCMIRAGMFF